MESYVAMLLGHDKHLEAEFTVETDADMRIRLQHWHMLLWQKCFW